MTLPMGFDARWLGEFRHRGTKCSDFLLWCSGRMEGYDLQKLLPFQALTPISHCYGLDTFLHMFAKGGRCFLHGLLMGNEGLPQDTSKPTFPQKHYMNPR